MKKRRRSEPPVRQGADRRLGYERGLHDVVVPLSLRPPRRLCPAPLRCAEGTSYSNFQHDWVEKVTAATGAYLEEACRRGLTAGRFQTGSCTFCCPPSGPPSTSPSSTTSPGEQIEAHCLLVCRLFNWFEVLRFSRPQGLTSPIGRGYPPQWLAKANSISERRHLFCFKKF